MGCSQSVMYDMTRLPHLACDAFDVNWDEQGNDIIKECWLGCDMEGSHMMFAVRMSDVESYSLPWKIFGYKVNEAAEAGQWLGGTPGLQEAMWAIRTSNDKYGDIVEEFEDHAQTFSGVPMVGVLTSYRLFTKLVNRMLGCTNWRLVQVSIQDADGILNPIPLASDEPFHLSSDEENSNPYSVNSIPYSEPSDVYIPEPRNWNEESQAGSGVKVNWPGMSAGGSFGEVFHASAPLQASNNDLYMRNFLLAQGGSMKVPEMNPSAKPLHLGIGER